MCVLTPVTGVVTKLGIHITPAPEAYASVEVSVPRGEDLVPLVGTLSDLMRRSITLNSPSIASVFRIAFMSKEPEIYARLAEHMKPGSYVPHAVLEEMRAKHGWGSWRAYFSLYGSVETFPALQKTVRRAFAAIPGPQITSGEFPGCPGRMVTAAEIKEEIPHSGIPTMAPRASTSSPTSTSTRGMWWPSSWSSTRAARRPRTRCTGGFCVMG